MGQEYFGGPEYFQEFDPEKCARKLKAEAARKAAGLKKGESSSEDASISEASTDDAR